MVKKKINVLYSDANFYLVILVILKMIQKKSIKMNYLYQTFFVLLGKSNLHIQFTA